MQKQFYPKSSNHHHPERPPFPRQCQSPQTRALTQYLEGQKIQVLPHPPYTSYSPDLTPCNFCLFLLWKDKLAERKFVSCSRPPKVMNSELKTIPKEEEWKGRHFPHGSGTCNTASMSKESTSRECCNLKQVCPKLSKLFP